MNLNPFLLYEKHLKKKLFNKLFLLYSIIIVVSLIGLASITSINYTNTIIQKELNFNKQVVERVSSYLNEKYKTSRERLQKLYTEKDLLTDVVYFIKHDISEYLTYRLDTYTANYSNDMQKYTSYIDDYLLDHDINDIMILSKKKTFLFHANYARTQRMYYGKSSMDLAKKLDELKLGDKNTIDPYIYVGLNLPEENPRVYTTINAIKDPTSMEIIGNIIVNYNTNGIYQSYAKYAKDIKGYIIILTSGGDVIYDSSEQYYGKKYPFFNMLKSPRQTLKLEEESYINADVLDSTGVIVAGIIPKSQIAESARLAQKTIFIVTAVLILGSILLTYFSAFIFSKRTKIIMQGMDNLHNGDLSKRIPTGRSDDELSQIAINFNSMCDSLNSYIERVYVSEIKQKNAEITALQTQVNPHFLYNTLEVIRMKAVSKGSPEIGDMVYNLASLFRNSVKSGMFINIYEEIEQCKLYLRLFKIRYEDRLDFNVDVHQEVLNYSIVKFSLQPIIENYFIHGINQDLPQNIITIQAVKDRDDIRFTIRDNGIGIESERLAHIKQTLEYSASYPSSSIGLSNVNERLKLIYGEQYGLDIDSEKNRGTTVSIKIPAKKKEDLSEYA